MEFFHLTLKDYLCHQWKRKEIKEFPKKIFKQILGNNFILRQFLSLRRKKKLGEEIKSVITKEIVTKAIARSNIKSVFFAEVLKNVHLSVASYGVIKRCFTKIATEKVKIAQKSHRKKEYKNLIVHEAKSF